MQPDQETVARADSMSPPGYRSDGVAVPLSAQPIPRHHDGGGDRAVSANGVPQDDLRPGGHNYPGRPDLSQAVAAQRDAYRDAAREHADAVSGSSEEAVMDHEDFEAYLAKVASSDAAHESKEPAVAPVTRRGPKRSANPPVTPPAPRKAATKADKTARQIEDISDEQLLADAGITPFYSTTEAAQFFDRTNQWLYWGLRKDTNGTPVDPVFIYPDGSPIEPEWVGTPGTGRRRFTLPIIKDILLSNYRRGNVEPDELKKILRRIRINELGGEWREREGWHKVRGKWVHPRYLEEVDGKWVRRKDAPPEDEE